jgi:hypothetical protein
MKHAVSPILDTIQHTRMQKSYKMAVFLCLVKDGDLVVEIGVNEIARYFRVLYQRQPYSFDLSEPSNMDLCEWPLSRIELFIVRNPLNHLVESSDGLFYLKNGRFGIIQRYYVELDPKTRAQEVEERVYDRLERYFLRHYGYSGAM